jgi:hypothetical protein
MAWPSQGMTCGQHTRVIPCHLEKLQSLMEVSEFANFNELRLLEGNVDH